ncbi:NAD(P)/FAD-dependent oxidoreductase [Mycolicibacterium vanbaalenii]|uniref:NAD(P)/FAD-dependent oxidoreductase n=1 Tax=Mycolicibacterium vanbaalenii TaxID=110539 RepID=UPI00132F7249|nr:NAD(P)/FAD-dependent oxidoreductase [Mycolicibacterium vanbaalenii]
MTEPAVIVIGSGPAGVGAAEEFRKQQADVPVRILTADCDEPYERPPLSKEFLRGETDEVSMRPSSWFAERDLELITDAPVTEIDTDARTVTAGGRRQEYRHLILASGASPRPLPVPGGGRALQLRSLQDAQRLRASSQGAQSAVVIGAGFIGCEAAASLARNGLAVTLVAPDAVPQEKRLGTEAGRRLVTLIEQTGARFSGGVRVREIRPGAVVLDDGATVEADLILAATGVEPNSAAAEAAGVPVDQSRIVVDAGMMTRTPGVSAAGDVALAFNTTAGRSLAVEHWQDAAEQGAIAGARAAGDQQSWSDVPGFWTTIGDTTLKYHAWGDGYERSRLIAHGDGFTVWYESGGVAVAVLTCNADDDYELGEGLIRAGAAAPVL